MKAGMVLPIHVWHNTMVCQRERPSQRVALLLTLYGHPGADAAMARYFADLEAWRVKWAPLRYGHEEEHPRHSDAGATEERP